jgi:hypothetical protein
VAIAVLQYGIRTGCLSATVMIENELDVLRDVTRRFESAGIAFMLTGSLAMNYYAQPRMTRDIDLVAQLDEPDTETVVSLFEPDYYLDRGAISRAIARHSMFNLIHNTTIIKVDCIVLKNDAYRRQEFARRRQITIGDFPTWIVSREDLILSKLYWAKDSRSEMQMRDVRGLLAAEHDSEYVRHWAGILGVEDLLQECAQPNE